MNELTLTSDESQFSMRVSLLQPAPSFHVTHCCRARGRRPVPPPRGVRRVDSWYDSGVRRRRACGRRHPAAAPAAADADEGLISYDTLSDDFKAVIDLQLASATRSASCRPAKVRNIADRGGVHGVRGKAGLSLAECESEVLRFLQRRAPPRARSTTTRDYATLGLLAVLLAGAGARQAGDGRP